MVCVNASGVCICKLCSICVYVNVVNVCIFMHTCGIFECVQMYVFANVYVSVYLCMNVWCVFVNMYLCMEIGG